LTVHIVAIYIHLLLVTPPCLLHTYAYTHNVLVSCNATGLFHGLCVRRVDEVQQSDLLISLDSPELEAQLDALHAARNQAHAQLDESLHGTREESIRDIKASLTQDESELRVAESDFERTEQRSRRGSLSRSRV
ncbi:secretion protein HlyD, partial [Pseudomonas aeruginosa]|nr:secretion protein HlyD [Pseudomonas aeruginosa]